jgi:hypothetical protein
MTNKADTIFYEEMIAMYSSKEEITDVEKVLIT